MDMHSPDRTPARSAAHAGQSSPNFIAHLLQTLDAAAPDTDTESHQDATRELFEGLSPRIRPRLNSPSSRSPPPSPRWTTLPAPPAPASRTTRRCDCAGSALAAGRAYAAALRCLRRQQAVAAQPPKPARVKIPPAAAPQPPPAETASETQEIPPGFIALRPGATPIPAVFRPHDRFADQIPDWRRDLMTPAQALAAFSYPPDPAQVAAAIAEEAAMMAEQTGLDIQGIRDEPPTGGAG